MLIDYLCSLANYNKAMNEKVYQEALKLPAETLEADKGAFFGSIMGTLNHMVVTDICWLKRFQGHPASFDALAPLNDIAWPEWYDSRMAPDLESLQVKRQELDDMILAWTNQLQDDDLGHYLQYQNMQGKDFCKPFGPLALHLFNHQIHHRGQVTTLLSQENLHIDGTGVLPFLPDGQA